MAADGISFPNIAHRYLQRAGFVVDHVASGAGAIAAEQPEVVLLDLGLPDMDGYDVCRRLRADSDVPLIVITARGEALAALGSVNIGATAGEEGKLFGSVGTRDIADALTAAGCAVDKAEVRLPEGAIRELGEFEIMIQLHAEVTTSVAINIVAE